MWILSRTGRGNIRESWAKCTEKRFFHVLRYNFNKSGISGAKGRRAKRIRCYYNWETRSAMCRINLSPYIARPYVRLATFIFTDFHAVRCDAIGWGLREYFLISGRSSGVYGVPRNIIAVYVPGQFSQVVRLYSCIIIPKVIFQKTHRLAKRILPRESVYFHLNYVHEYKFIYIRFIASDFP